MATLVRHDRPRDLRWYLAGPMFFGDLGTSRLYVLGLALFYAGTAAPYFVAAICALVLLVGWAYTIVCRVNPDGGGVYSSGRMLHPTLGVVGALLLFANYVVTAAISTYVAMIYIGGPFGMARELAPWLSLIAIGALGALNYVGSRRAGMFALLVCISAIAVTAIMASLTITHVPEGWGAIAPPSGGPWKMWLTFVAVVLALSGVESIANMTGIMVEPVKRTSRLSIWPVVGEVVLLNLILVFVVVSLPELGEIGIIADKDPAQITEHEHALKDQVLYVVAERYVGHAFATIASIVFGLLLLSATNTAIIAMISIQYAMSRDRELPEFFSRINFYGVPWYGLIGACALPAIVCILAQDVQTLAQLYAIGVVGAIAINLGSCAYNRDLKILKPERIGLWVLGIFMGIIWLTIAVTNLWATVFLSVILSGGMCLRYAAKWVAARVPPVPVPGELAPELAAEPVAPLLPFDPDKGRILVATRGNLNLLRFAFKEARQHTANLFVLFVRDINVLFPGRERPLSPEEDGEAASLFHAAREMAREQGVPLQDIYCVSPDPSDVILDFAATYAADMVILGVSRRAGVLRALRGDVISGVADNLPAESTLLIHA